MRSKTFLAILVLLAAVQQIAAPPLIFPSGDPNGPLPPRPPSPLEPAGYAFAIWGLIYVAALAYGIHQLFGGRGSKAVGVTRAPALALYLGSTIWLVCAQALSWATIPVILVMVALAFAAFLRAARTANGRSDDLLVVAPFGLYAGWLTIALFANIATVGPAYGFDFLGLGERAWAFGSIAAASALSVAALWASRGRLSYAAAMIWALVALIVANRALGEQAIMVTLAAACALVLGAAVTFRRGRRLV